MTPDRNKTPLTHAITKCVALWMDERGFKPVETEVWLGDKWIADLAGVITPTQTELIDLKLIKRAPKTWGSEWTDEQKLARQAEYDAWRATRDAIPGILTCAVEVKVSRSDFTGDWKWQAPAQTDLRYIAMPRGLIPDHEWPAGWGIIEMSADGETVLKAHRPAIIEQSTEQRLKVVLSLAVRQYNTVHYARQREWQKKVTLQQSERRANYRVQDAMNTVMDVIGGEPIERVLGSYRITGKLDEHTVDRLRRLAEKVAAKQGVAA